MYFFFFFLFCFKKNNSKRKPNLAVIKVLCQIIGKLKISSETENQTIKELRVLSKTFTTHLDDKTSINYLTKFSTSLQSLDKTPQISLDPSVVQNLQNLMGPEETLKETTNSRKKSVQEKYTFLSFFF